MSKNQKIQKTADELWEEEQKKNIRKWRQSILQETFAHTTKSHPLARGAEAYIFRYPTETSHQAGSRVLARFNKKHRLSPDQIKSIKSVLRLPESPYIMPVLYFRSDMAIYPKYDGDLYQLPQINKKEISQEKRKEAAFIIAQIILAIAFLHKNNMVHRDIKAGNILFKKNEGDQYPRICLADISSIISCNEKGQPALEALLDHIVYTPGYVPNDIQELNNRIIKCRRMAHSIERSRAEDKIKTKLSKSADYKKADWYALGKTIENLINRGCFPESDNLKKLITTLMSADVQLSDIKNHSFFKEYADDQQDFFEYVETSIMPKETRTEAETTQTDEGMTNSSSPACQITHPTTAIEIKKEPRERDQKQLSSSPQREDSRRYAPMTLESGNYVFPLKRKIPKKLKKQDLFITMPGIAQDLDTNITSLINKGKYYLYLQSQGAERCPEAIHIINQIDRFSKRVKSFLEKNTNRHTTSKLKIIAQNIERLQQDIYQDIDTSYGFKHLLGEMIDDLAKPDNKDNSLLTLLTTKITFKTHGTFGSEHETTLLEYMKSLLNNNDTPSNKKLLAIVLALKPILTKKTVAAKADQKDEQQGGATKIRKEFEATRSKEILNTLREALSIQRNRIGFFGSTGLKIFNALCREGLLTTQPTENITDIQQELASQEEKIEAVKSLSL